MCSLLSHEIERERKTRTHIAHAHNFPSENDFVRSQWVPQCYAWRVQKHIFSPKNVIKTLLLPLLLPLLAPKMQIKYRYIPHRKMCDKVFPCAGKWNRWKRTRRRSSRSISTSNIQKKHTQNIHKITVQPFVKCSVWFRLIVILLGIPWRFSTASSWSCRRFLRRIQSRHCC